MAAKRTMQHRVNLEIMTGFVVSFAVVVIAYRMISLSSMRDMLQI